MNQITAKELKHRLDAGESIKLLNALEPNKFEAKHIPHSINLLLKEDIERNLDKRDCIIVYCTDLTCTKSIVMYQLRESLGYKNICRFAGGLIEWEKEGFPLEGTAV